ncbi:MAG: S41 family peptidase [Prolixibacteraceae bacterium]|nr:S41 family peptidase [Prolixibacteraceae bacterium]MBN2773642.1 S41 family peptidase [Prolixibacteraceae bacterium]
MKIRKLTIAMIIILIAGIGLFSFNNDQKNFNIAKNLDIYYTLFNELNTFYVDEINPNKLVKSSIDQMLNSLDPYTNYISEDDIEDFRFMTTGEYAGIGALIGKQNGQIVISESYEGYPAQINGIKAGDILLEVAGKSTENMSTEDVSSLLKGPARKPVKVKLQRPGEKKPFELEIVREKISIDAVPYYGMLDKSTGYIRLSNFTQDCSQEVRKAFEELKSQHHPESLVLDLRSNPGGLLIEAVRIMNLFVPAGEDIVSTKGKVKQWDQTYKSTIQPIDTTIKIAVLVNRNSASASEIIAGAMQDLDRGLIIGTRTFGKGLVQTTRDLSYNAKLKVTTAKYYIPSGRCIQVLDYSHRNEDGSVGSIPDSLITEFSTKNGRKVYDGGGVAPDVFLEPESLSTLSFELASRFLIFDFATKYSNSHSSIPEPEKYELSNETYNDFITFVQEKGFEYDSQSQEVYKELLETAKREKYFDSASEEFKALEEKLTPNLKSDLLKFKPEISELLKDEIVSRYYYQKGAIRSAIEDDKLIKKAMDVLSDNDVYAGHFSPGIIIKSN